MIDYRFLLMILAIGFISPIANASAQDKFFGQLSFGQSYSSRYKNINPDSRWLIDNSSSSPSYFTGVGLGYIVNQPLRFGMFFYNSNYNFNAVNSEIQDGDKFEYRSKIKIHSNALMIEGFYRFTFSSKKCIDNKLSLIHI